MSKYEAGLQDGLADVGPESNDTEYLRGYRAGQRALDEDERGIGPGWDD